MTELFAKIMAGCIIVLFGWLLKMSSDHRKFRRNCLTELKEEMKKFGTSLARLEEQVEAAKIDIKSLFNRLNKHINGAGN